MAQLFYTDRSGIRHLINFEVNEYDNLMELILDKGYEDWGDCRGRAWCATCHVQVCNNLNTNNSDSEEKQRIGLLSNRTERSRLSCQLFLTKNLQEAEIKYLGDD